MKLVVTIIAERQLDFERRAASDYANVSWLSSTVLQAKVT